MVEDIEIPEISHAIRMRYIPSHEDAHMEFVSEQDEHEIIERLSREASEYSEMIGNVREFELIGEETINACLTIQKIFRGFSSRKIISFYFPPYSMRHPIRFRNALQARTSIRFINTGDDLAEFCWIKSDGSFGNSTPIYMSRTPHSVFGASISTFPGHWFLVSFKRPVDGVITRKYIRIPLNFVSGWLYDVNTGITLTGDQWYSSSCCARIYLKNTIQAQLPNNSIRETSLTDDDEGFEGRMSLAIDDRLPMTSHMNTV